MDPIGSATSSSSSTSQATSAAPNDVMGKDAFLKLLTAQLSNQDPLQPVDNQAFIAQLAQFSSLEQLQGVSSRLDSLLLATTSQNQLAAASLVGKSVSYQGDSGALVTDQVRGVDVSGGEPQLLVGTGEVKLSQVVQITQPAP